MMKLNHIWLLGFLLISTSILVACGDTNSQNAVTITVTPVTSNESWTPQEQDFDGVTMVLVPAGCFVMGDDNSPFEDEKPAHEQCFDKPFWIDKYEVTQAQFTRFNGQRLDENYFVGDDLPVEKVSWDEAHDYCQLRGVRLPTEREWEYAARGPNNLVYPWGNEFVEDSQILRGGAMISVNNRLSYGGTRMNGMDGETAPVGSYETGVSWVGAMDMSGNVTEWVSSVYADYPYDSSHENDDDKQAKRVLRGGSWQDINATLKSSFRGQSEPDYGNHTIGFRCARSQ